jgi:hypothetical protein
MPFAFEWFAAGAALGALAVGAWSRGRRAALQAERDLAQSQLSELRGQLRGLRHDMRGILSPALLVSDRLLTHEEPHVKRAGDVMMRTVERAVSRLAEIPAEHTPVQTGPASAQL